MRDGKAIKRTRVRQDFRLVETEAGRRLTSLRTTSAPTCHARQTPPRRTRCRPLIAAEVRHVIVLVGVEPRHEGAPKIPHLPDHAARR